MKDGSIRILLIEDNPGDARLIGEMLAEAKGLGYELIWVDSLTAGIERLGRCSVDVVLLDLGLPESTGLATLKRLRAGVSKAPTLLVMSGLADEEVAVQAVQAGAQDYLVKGRVDSALLARAIRYAIERSQAEDALRRAHGELEQRVAERTAELARAIDALHAEIAERTRAQEQLKHHRDRLEELVRERTEELTVAKERAEVASHVKSAFLASMSHELRTPLNAILGYAQILKRDRALSGREAVGLNTIQQSGEHLLMLIDDILDLSRIEAGKLELYPGAVDLSEFLRVIADTIRIKAEQKSLSFAFEAPSRLPRIIQVDDNRLRQILLNLLSNAVKFTDVGGVILRVGVVPGGTDANVRLRFEVDDTGIGIAEKQRETIFQPFEQVGDVQRRPGGTGLGLAISRQLARLMGSDIHAESRIGQGSRFWFDIDLPVLGVEVTSPTLPRAIRGYQGPRRKIVVVDDVASSRAVVADLLHSLDFEVIEAANGQEALEQTQAHRPDLIVMDIIMPVMDGLEAIRRLREQPALKNTRVIAVSASASATEQQKTRVVGADAFLPKPIHFDQFLQHIESLLQLTWVVADSDNASAAGAEAVDVPMLLPHDEMEVLHRLAMIGNMHDVRERATYLATLDESYRPFADKLRRLADGYQSKAILGLVEKCMARIGR